MDTEKITRYYEEAINSINNASESGRNEIADYLIGYYNHLNTNKLREYNLTKEEATEIANRLRAYKENSLDQGIESVVVENTATNANNVTGNNNINNDIVTQKVNNAIDALNATNSLNIADNSQALSQINNMIDYYTSLSGDNMRREGITSYDEAREIARRLAEYRDNELTNREREATVEEEKTTELSSESEIRPVSLGKEEEKLGEAENAEEAEIIQPEEELSLSEVYAQSNTDENTDSNEEEVEIVNEELKPDTENEIVENKNMRVNNAVDYVIWSSEKLNLDEALEYIQKEIDKYNNYKVDKGSRYSAVEAKEIAKKLELYKQGLMKNYEKFKKLDDTVTGHIKYAETLELNDSIEYVDKTINYYNNNSSDKFTKEDTEYIVKRLTAYKNTLEDRLDNKNGNQNENEKNKESRIKVVGKRVCKWISKHKRQILIGVGCAAIATGLFAISASAIPTLMAANSANWWIAKSVGNVALMNTLHANNIALGAKVGAVFAGKVGTWTIPAGAVIGKSALVSSIAGVSGFGVSSVVSALHKKFVPKTNSNGEEIVSKEEAKIYYDRGYKKGLKKGRKETNDREYNDGFDAGYDAALEDMEKDNKDNKDNKDDKSKTSFQSLRNGFARLFNKSKKKNDDDEWEPIVSNDNNNSNRPSLSEREDWRKHFANNGVENPGVEKPPIIDVGVISTDEFEQSATENDVAENVASSVANFMNDTDSKEAVPVTQEDATKKVSLEKPKTENPYGELAEDMTRLYSENLGEKPVSPTNSFVYNAEKDKTDDIWTIAHRAGGYYIENSKKTDIDAEIKALKDKLVLDTPEKEKDWELGFKAGMEDYKKKIDDFNKKAKYASLYLNLEQLNDLNPGANITVDDANPNILYSDIDANLLTLPNGWYYNNKNGITNKHNTETGMYQSYTVEKYQEEKNNSGSHRR